MQRLSHAARCWPFLNRRVPSLRSSLPRLVRHRGFAPLHADAPAAAAAQLNSRTLHRSERAGIESPTLGTTQLRRERGKTYATRREAQSTHAPPSAPLADGRVEPVSARDRARGSMPRRPRALARRLLSSLSHLHVVGTRRCRGAGEWWTLHQRSDDALSEHMQGCSASRMMRPCSGAVSRGVRASQSRAPRGLPAWAAQCGLWTDLTKPCRVEV